MTEGLFYDEDEGPLYGATDAEEDIRQMYVRQMYAALGKLLDLGADWAAAIRTLATARAAADGIAYLDGIRISWTGDGFTVTYDGPAARRREAP